MKRVIEVSDTLYETCKRLVSNGDPRPSESCIANSNLMKKDRQAIAELADIVIPKIRNAIAVHWNERVVRFLLVMITSVSFTRKAVRNEQRFNQP